MIRMKCDKAEKGCQKEFDVDEEAFTKTLMEIDGDECLVTFFTCPPCGEKYVVSTVNTKVRNLLVDIKNLNKKLSRNLTTQADVERHNKLIKKKDKTKALLADCQRELNRLVYLRL